MQKLTIVKIGGNVIDNAEACSRFLSTFASLSGAKLLVHGGGKVATDLADKMGLVTQMVNGRRITDKPTLDIAIMVYAGLVNKSVVATLQAYRCNALGLTGADAGCVISHKRPVLGIDYGFVGDIDHVDDSQISNFILQGLVPVFAPLTFDGSGILLNTNADTMASALAVALSTSFDVTLLYCFEKKGVLADPSQDTSVIPFISQTDYVQLKEEGTVSKGMIPKMDNAFDALRKGVAKVVICHADDLELYETADSFGTLLSLEV
ncbi:MAG: acetylglutamate kinase [Bacteroidota bacterium]